MAAQTRGLQIFPSLGERSEEEELIDAPDSLASAETRRMLAELALVNRWLGGRRSMRRLAGPLLLRLSQASPDREILVADLGSGGGDLARALVDWARVRKVRLRVVAIDFSHRTSQLAREGSGGYPEIDFVSARVGALPVGLVDLSICSAFLHHFGSDDLISILAAIRERTKEAILISDLERNLLAYWGIVLLSRLFSRSHAVCHDGPLSVRRGFRKPELRDVVRKSGAPVPSIARSWAFRLNCLIDCRRTVQEKLSWDETTRA